MQARGSQCLMSGLLLAMFTLTNTVVNKHHISTKFFLIRVFFKKILFSISQLNSAASAENVGIFVFEPRYIHTCNCNIPEKRATEKVNGGLARNDGANI